MSRMPYLRATATIPAVLGPHLLFVAIMVTFGDRVRIEDEVSRFGVVIAATLGIGIAIVCAAFTWVERKDPATSKVTLAAAVAATTLSAIGMGVGFWLHTAVFWIFFLLSLPTLLFAIWNARAARNAGAIPPAGG